MLYLSEQNIKEAVTMKDVIDAIDETYRVYESGQFQMPQRMHLKEEANTLLLMPSITEDAIGTKLVTIFPNNQKLPTLHGLVVLNSSETGEIKGILNGAFLTGMRTGAIGGSGVRHLAKKDAKSTAIVGTGVQGLYQAIAACTERPIETVNLFNRSPEKIPAFKESLQKWVGSEVAMKSHDSVEEAIKDVDIIITTTTSNEPVLPDNPDILKNKLVIGVGSFQPTMREFPESLFKVADKVMVDTEHAIKESGDIATPIEKGWIDRDSILTVSELVSNNKQVNIQEGGTIVLKSTGMGLFDVVVANLMYQKAQAKEVGTNLSM
ncbi:ornithine cyclodeaminase family protein [Lentibacillus sp. CBA3610]|uniref:ornithine cyclodeaminase family protein n=1 Tax=Lentibacillus sp. CBA3610 TaxID=2518176 RepID=UPI00159604C9|nr:ornithine cyclodeaminase family protein [Lentibacillus sp. CBA3610]QKY70192.1 ornithine cyclodeaminase family protein [Lentibacillus sp. CBA3610]